MRDPKRIPKILKRIERLWKKYPDLRLGQLIVNVYGINDIYYKEDAAFIETLEEYYNLEKK